MSLESRSGIKGRMNQRYLHFAYCGRPVLWSRIRDRTADCLWSRLRPYWSAWSVTSFSFTWSRITAAVMAWLPFSY